MEIVVGTYDDVILGFRLLKIADDFQVEASFTDNSHSGCVKCMAVSEKGILASGSTDESIRLLNIRKMKEMGSLVHHNGTVTSLQFHKGFLFSTSEDAALCLWKSFTWECLRTFKGHQSAIDCVSVHPSGKLALTVGRDRALHTWNLITGRSAFISNIKQAADIVCWSPEGDNYAIVVNNKIDVYDVETAEVSLTVKAASRINCLQYYNEETLCYGGEGGDVHFHHIPSNKPLHTCSTGTIRIKGLCIKREVESISEDPILCVAGSDGALKLYTITESKKVLTTRLLVEKSTGFRITCMAVFVEKAPPPKMEKINKREKKLKRRAQMMSKAQAVTDDGDENATKTVEKHAKVPLEKGSKKKRKIEKVKPQSKTGDVEDKSEDSRSDRKQETVVKANKRKSDSVEVMGKKKVKVETKTGKTKKQAGKGKQTEVNNEQLSPRKSGRKPDKRNKMKGN